MFIWGDMDLKYGNEKRVCTPFDVVLAFFGIRFDCGCKTGGTIYISFRAVVCGYGWMFVNRTFPSMLGSVFMEDALRLCQNLFSSGFSFI